MVSQQETIGISWEEIDNVIIIQDKNFGDATLLIPVIESLLKVSLTLQIFVYAPAPYHHFLSLDSRVQCRAIGSAFYLLFSLLNFKRGLVSVFLDFQPTLRYRFLAKISGANVISGLVNDRQFLSVFDTHRARPLVANRLQCESNLDVLRRLGCDAVFMVESFRRLSQNFARPFCFSSTSYIVVHAGSRWMFKSLSNSQWLDLVRGLIIEYKATIVLTGGDSDQEKELASHLTSLPNVVSYVGKTSTKELIAIIRDSIGFVGVDTFASHLAAFLKVPGVVIFGPTNTAVWGPHRSTLMKVYTIDQYEYPCMPCNQDGCGGSKVSQCLRDASTAEILNLFQVALSASAGLR